MSDRCFPLFACALACLVGLTNAALGQSSTRSSLASNTEPGTIYVEDILPKKVQLSVLVESVIYYQADLQRALGSMATGTPVQLVAMSDNAYKVRGRARHGDVAGWMKMADLKSPDPKLPEKLKAFYERQKKVDELIANHQVALGMTTEEVKLSMGKPTQKTAKITAAGKEETLAYSIYDRVPQIVTGRDQVGNLIQNTIYVKVEVGRLSLSFKNNAVSEIQESMGNPLGNGGVKIVPVPINVF